jgi:DNA repair photolyase
VVRRELARPGWRREYVAVGTVTDPYQPLEGRYRLTRGVLQACADYDTPVGIITRSPLVVRDVDVLQELARNAGAGVSISIATLDEALAREIEPTVAPPRQRLRAVSLLATAGISVNVALAPVIPHLTDAPESLDAVVRAARDAGAEKVWHNTLYLHDVTREAFFAYVRQRKPQLADRYERIYRGTYAPGSVTSIIDRDVKAALRAHPKREAPRITAQGPRQISLL